MPIMMACRSRIGTLGVIVVAAASLCLPACASRICSCPGEGGHVDVPADLPAPIAKVTASSPCEATQENATSIFVFRMSGGTCHVVAQLTDGSNYEATATFQEAPCGCVLTTAVSPLTPVER
jgi:hypothetical protein